MDEAKKTMIEALRKIDDIEINLMNYINTDDIHLSALYLHDILHASHEAKKLIRLIEYRARKVEES